MPLTIKRGSRGKFKLEQRMPLLSKEEKVEFRQYDYPFENLAFEGGGCKGIAYVGVIRVLEEVGIYRTMRRFAGTSAGSIGAMFGALGCDSYEIEEFMSVNLEKLLCDATLGKASFPLMMRRFGLHPGNKFLKWCGKIVAKKLGHPDATFADLYQQTGRELCVVAVNVNQLDCEYFHVKTTPDTPIRIAVRMSSGIPGLVAPVKYKLHGVEQLFVDGGLVANYPIHVFDGWYLSMDDEDSFLRRIPDIRNATGYWDTSKRFGTEPNKKTLGILLFSDDEQEMFKVQLDERLDKYVNKTPVPNTKFTRQRQKSIKKKSAAVDEHDELVETMSTFVDLMRNADVDCSGTISRDELKTVLEKAGEEFGKEERVCLFGRDMSPDELFDTIDRNGDGEITMKELLLFADQRGIQLRKTFRGFDSRNIKTLGQYFDGLLETMLLNMKKIFMRGCDLHRTIGVNTMYVDTLDFVMEQGDRDFLLQQGKNACLAFLRSHIDAQDLRKRVTSNSSEHDAVNSRSRSKNFVPDKFYNSFKKSKKRRETKDMMGHYYQPPTPRESGGEPVGNGTIVAQENVLVEESVET